MTSVASIVTYLQYKMGWICLCCCHAPKGLGLLASRASRATESRLRPSASWSTHVDCCPAEQHQRKRRRIYANFDRAVIAPVCCNAALCRARMSSACTPSSSRNGHAANQDLSSGNIPGELQARIACAASWLLKSNKLLLSNTRPFSASAELCLQCIV